MLALTKSPAPARAAAIPGLAVFQQASAKRPGAEGCQGAESSLARRALACGLAAALRWKRSSRARVRHALRAGVKEEVLDMSKLEQRIKDLQGLKARELRSQLDALGISTKGCMDRESLVELLETEGRKVLLSSPEHEAQAEAQATQQRMEELRALKARDLRKELSQLGLDTEGYVDKESLLELLESQGPEAIQRFDSQPPQPQQPPPPQPQQPPPQSQQQPPPAGEGQKKQNPFKDAKPPPVAAEPQAGMAECKIFLMRTLQDKGVKSDSKLITIELEVGCSPLRFVVDTCSYHSIMKEALASNLHQARLCGEPDWAREEAPGVGIKEAVISNAWMADGKIEVGEVVIATIPASQELPVPVGCAGILGLDFLTLFDWDFDIKGCKARIATAPKDRKAPLPFDTTGLVPVPMLKIRTPSRAELYACQVKLAAAGDCLEDEKVKFIQGFPDLALSNTICNKIAAKGLRKKATKGFGAGNPVKGKKKKYVDHSVEELDVVFGIGNGPQGCSVREGIVLAGDVEEFQVLRLTEWPTVILGADVLIRDRLALSFRQNRMYLPSGSAVEGVIDV